MPFLRKYIFIFLVLFIALIVNKVQAQSSARTHFIYIQSEDQQPYYVILNNKSYSSSSVGYLIISKLTDGDYKVTVGFPQDIYPATTYLLKIKGNDAGFNLRKGSGKGWDLVDKLSHKELPVVNAGDNVDPSSVANLDSQKKDNGFGDLLSKTSNDTTNYQAYAPSQNKAGDVAKATMPGSTAKKDKVRTDQQSSTTAVAEAPKSDGSVDESYESAAARSATESVVKLGERSDRRGVSLAFVVTSGEKMDTINAFFPGDSKKSTLEDDNEAVANNNADTENISPEKTALKKEVDSRKGTNNPFFKGTTTANKNGNLGLFAEGDSGEAKTEQTKASAKEDNVDAKTTDTNSGEIFNSTCTSMVSDKDIEKIRKRMIAKSSDEDMIAVARKYVDTKCIYTAQIKELGGLLISDNGRFALYRILYPNVYDGGQFKTLEDQLLDKNYKAQFRSLTNNH
ncbi:MAG: DUF4476 domain-containing protein [Chitinophagaceae bacterium]